MKVVTVVGTRPEFIQVAPLTRALRARHQEILVHTGQHYDANMSQVFFDELELPQPERLLEVGSGSHGAQTGRLLIAVERVLVEESPDWVLVFGDTNSTLAGALAAAKLGIPLAHIEAGLRSFDRAMPEEVNRIATDHMSDLLLPPTADAVANLAREGLTQGVEMVGDVRIDLLERSAERARDRLPLLLARSKIAAAKPFALATIHRASNTDDSPRLGRILAAFGELDLEVVLPMHPRLTKMVKLFGLRLPSNVHPVAPLGFLDLVALLDHAEVVLTDSGGLQKEAYMLRRPTVTLRDTTEWVETVQAGWNRLAEPEDLVVSVAAARGVAPPRHPDFYGAPGVCDRIVDLLERGRPVRRKQVPS